MLTDVDYDDKSGSGAGPFSTYVSRSYGPKCVFQYGDRRHLGFCRLWDLMVKIVLGPHFQFLCQIWCESVQKWHSYGVFVEKPLSAAVVDIVNVN